MPRSGIFVSISGSTQGLDKALGKAARTLGSFGGKLTKALTLPLAALGVGSTKAFADFQSALQKSIAISDDFAAKQGELAKAARDAALTSAFSAAEVAESYFFLASAGLDAERSIASLGQVMAFATAGQFDLARATDLATDAQSALGLTVKDAAENLENLTRVTDVLVKANTLANATVEQFASALTTKAGASARQVGKDIEEVVAVLAALADQGVKGEEAGTQLSIVLRDLQTKALENAEAFETASVSVFDSGGEMRNLSAILVDLERKLEGASDATQKLTLLNLGFSDRSIGTLQAVIGLSDAIAEYEFNLRQAENTTQEVAEKQLETLANQFKILRGRVVDAAISVGEALAPTVAAFAEIATRAADIVGRWAKAFESLSPETRNAAIRIALVAASIGPLLLGVATLIRSVRLLTGVLRVLVTNPLVALTAVIATVVTSFGILSIEIADASEKVRGFANVVEETEDRVRRAAEDLRETISVTEAIEKNREEYEKLQQSIEKNPLTIGLGGVADLRGGQLARLEKEFAALTERITGLTEAEARRNLQSAKSAAAEARLAKEVRVANGVYEINGDAIARTSRVLEAHKRFIQEAIEAGIDPMSERLQSQQKVVEVLTEDLKRYQEQAAKTKDAVGRAEISKQLIENLKLVDVASLSTASSTEILTAKFNAANAVYTDYVNAWTQGAEALAQDETFLKLKTKVEELDQKLIENSNVWTQWFENTGNILSNTQLAVNEFSAITFEAFQGFAEGFGNAAAATLVYGESLADGLEQVWRSVAATIISNLAKLIVQLIVYAATQKAINESMAENSVFTAAAEVFAKTFATVSEIPVVGIVLAPILAAAAAGAVVAGGLAFFADGGLVLGPTLGMVGEAGPELIIPLDRVGDVLGDAAGIGRYGRVTGPQGVGGSTPVILQVDGRTLGQVVLDRAFGPEGEARLRLGNI